MADDQPARSRKPIYWALTIVAFLALCAWAYVGTKKSNHEVAQATQSGAGVGTAYDPTTGKITGAGATPGALGVAGPQPATVAPLVATAPAADSPAGR